MTESCLDRRAFVFTVIGGLKGAQAWAQSVITRPVVSEQACPLEIIHPTANDGHRGIAVLRKPPGAGPFPTMIWFHSGIVTSPLTRLEATARDATPSRFLAAGYVLVAPTYRSRDVDPQTPDSVEDALAIVEYLRNSSFVDRRSLIVAGCSGGGDLALQVAARTRVCAVVAEEPASLLMSGVFTKDVPKKGARYTPEDSLFLLEDGRRYYTAELQKAFRAKLKSIGCPILIVQGDVDRRELPINRFNADVLVPELRATGRHFAVSTYPEQQHCFCASSGDPGRFPPRLFSPPPESWPAAALKAFNDIDAFCRRYVRAMPKPIDAHLITREPVRQAVPR